jgi:hypothetical protein
MKPYIKKEYVNLIGDGEGGKRRFLKIPSRFKVSALIPVAKIREF